MWPGTAVSKVLPIPHSKVGDGHIVLVATTDPSGTNTNAGLGLWFSTNGGDSFTKLSGDLRLPKGAVTDIVLDPIIENATDGVKRHFYAAVRGSGIYLGIFDLGRSEFDGWAAVNNGLPARATIGRTLLALHNSPASGGNTVLYAAIAAQANQRLIDVFRGDDGGSMWTPLGTSPPQTTEGTTTVGLHTANQGELHFSLLAHPTDPKVAFVGGAAETNSSVGFPTPNSSGCVDYGGRIFRGDANLMTTQAQTWEPVICGYAQGTLPHADSRAMLWDTVDNSIIQLDDGGIYKLQSPDDRTVDMTTALVIADPTKNDPGARQWVSLNGNLRVAEATTVAYDSLNNVVFAGTQDNGSVQQTVASATDGMPDTSGPWETVLVADGVKVDGGRVQTTTGVVTRDAFMRYYQNNDFGWFENREYSFGVGGAAQNTRDSEEFMPLTAAGNLTVQSGLRALDDSTNSAHDPIFPTSAANAVNPRTILLGKNGLYESAPPEETTAMTSWIFPATVTAVCRARVVESRTTARISDLWSTAGSSEIPSRAPSCRAMPT